MLRLAACAIPEAPALRLRADYMVEIKAGDSPKQRRKLRSQSRSPAAVRSRSLRLELSEAADAKVEDTKVERIPGCRGNRFEGWFDEGEDPCDDPRSSQDACATLIGEEPDEVAVTTGRRKIKDAENRPPSRPKSKSRQTRAQSVDIWLSKRQVDSRRAKSVDADEGRRSASSTKKTPRGTQPSLLFRVRPTNMEESMKLFFASDYKTAPQFTYTFDDDYVAKNFAENSKCCTELLPEAERILKRVQEQYGGPDAFMQGIYGGGQMTAEELQDMAADYLREHNIFHRVNIVVQDEMLCAASVLKPAFSDEKYTLNLATTPPSCRMVQGICDHEIGTHLLRMINDEHQVWHRDRERYKLINPWVTEEGFATLNTYLSMPCKLLYPQAMRYWACCRGAQIGFVELFSELRGHIPDPARRWQLCCRIKRGLKDTSQAGSFCMDQAYFKGAVEILRRLEEVDFPRLYSGQLALQDLDKVQFLLRLQAIQLPHFMNSAEKLEAYKEHCHKLICENQIQATVNYVSKPTYLAPGSTKDAKDILKRAASSKRIRAKSVPLMKGADGDKDDVGDGAAKTARCSGPPALAQELELPPQAKVSARARDTPPRGRHRKSEKVLQVMQDSTPSQKTGEDLPCSGSTCAVVAPLPSEVHSRSGACKEGAIADVPAKEGPCQSGEMEEKRNCEVSKAPHRTRTASRSRMRRHGPEGLTELVEGQSSVQSNGDATLNTSPQKFEQLPSSPASNASPQRRTLRRSHSRGKLTKANYERLSNAADAVCTAMESFLSGSLEKNPAENSASIVTLAEASCLERSHSAVCLDPASGSAAMASQNKLLQAAEQHPKAKCSSPHCSLLEHSSGKFGGCCCSGCLSGSHSLLCEGLQAPTASARPSSTRKQGSLSGVATADPKPQSGDCSITVVENIHSALRFAGGRAHSSKCEGKVAGDDVPLASPAWLPRKARRSIGDGDDTIYESIGPSRDSWKCASPGCEFLIHRKAKYGGYCCDRCYGYKVGYSCMESYLVENRRSSIEKVSTHDALLWNGLPVV